MSAILPGALRAGSAERSLHIAAQRGWTVVVDAPVAPEELAATQRVHLATLTAIAGDVTDAYWSTPQSAPDRCACSVAPAPAAEARRLPAR